MVFAVSTCHSGSSRLLQIREGGLQAELTMAIGKERMKHGSVVTLLRPESTASACCLRVCSDVESPGKFSGLEPELCV